MRRWHMRKGITRTVLLTSRWAIKVPCLRPYGEGIRGRLWGFCRGVLANQSEANWWHNATPDQKPFLCPVRWSLLGGIINVYPRAEPYEVPDSTRQAMFDRLDFPLPDLVPQLSDNKPENYGWLNNRPVVLDYDWGWNGCPHDRSGVFNRRDSERLDELMAWCAAELGNSHIHRRVRELLGVPYDAYPWQTEHEEMTQHAR